jgi:hypothetical protein
VSTSDAPIKGPSFFSDWGRSLPLVWAATLKCPIASIVLLIISISMGLCQVFRKESWILSFVQCIPLCYLSYSIAKSISLGKGTAVAKDRSPITVVGKVLMVEASYAALTLLLTILIVPGLWWATTSSLAIIVAYLENRRLGDCFSRSRTLVSGHFWLAFRYAIGGPGALGAICAIPLVAVIFIDGFPPSKLSMSVVPAIVNVVMSVLSGWLALSMIPPLVLLYWYLREKKEFEAISS